LFNPSARPGAQAKGPVPKGVGEVQVVVKEASKWLAALTAGSRQQHSVHSGSQQACGLAFLVLVDTPVEVLLFILEVQQRSEALAARRRDP